MFAKHKLRRRDPMFMTGATLLELEGFPSQAALLRHAASVDTAQLALDEQWLFDGMSQNEVHDAFVSCASSCLPSLSRLPHLGPALG